MSDVFSTRELAFGFWLCVALSYVLSQSAFRNLLIGLIKHGLHKRLVKVYAITFFYIAFIVFLLAQVGVWNLAHLKSTIIWGISVGFLSLFKINLHRKAEDFSYFKEVIADNLKLIVVIEFLISTYTLNLWAELLLLPFVTVVTYLIEFTKGKTDLKLAHTVFTNIAALLGAGIIIYVLWRLFSDFSSFISTKTVADFMLPPILTFLFLPYLYGLAVYSIYETTFSVIGIKIKDPKVRDYAHFASIMAFGQNVKLLRRWQHDTLLLNPQSKSDVRHSIRDVFRRHEKEKNPPVIPFEEGWSPYLAKEFLADHGLTSGEYQRTALELPDWYASSNHIDLSAGGLPNHISYTIDGDEDIAKQLQLTLNINECKHADAGTETLLRLAEALCAKALAREMPLELKSAILRSKDASQTVRDKNVSLEHEHFQGGVEGYTAYFKVGYYRPSYMNAYPETSDLK